MMVLAVLTMFAPVTWAATVDFTDGVYTTVVNSGINSAPVIFTETVDGVTFTLESTLNLVGTERFLGIQEGVPSNGLQVGGGGGSTILFTLSVNNDVTLNSYSTDTGGFFLGAATMNISGGSVTSSGNSLAQGNPANTFVGGALDLEAGVVYTFDLENTGAATQSYIASLDFTPVSTVPVPMAIWLLASGLVAAAPFTRRR